MKKTFLLFPIAAIAGFLLLAGCSKSQSSATGGGQSGGQVGDNAPVTMKVKWTPGKTYVMRMSMNQTMEMTPPGQTKPMQSVTDMDENFNMSVISNMPDGGYHQELEFQGINLKSTMGDREVMNFDSSQPTDQDGKNPAAGIFRKMIGTKLEYYLDANGKVDRIDGADEMEARITQGADPASQSMFKSMFSGDMLKQYNSLADMLPDHPVKPGDSWTVTKTINTPMGALKTDSDYTYKGWEQHMDHHCMRSDFKGTMVSAPNTSGTAPTINATLKTGKISGSTWMDPDIGIPVDTYSEQNFSVSIPVAGKIMDLTMHQKVQVVLVEVDDLTPK